MNRFKHLAALIVGLIVFYLILTYGEIVLWPVWTIFCFSVGIWILANLAKFRAVLVKYEEEKEDSGIKEIRKKQELARKHKGYSGNHDILQQVEEKMASRKPVDYAVFDKKKAK